MKKRSLILASVAVLTALSLVACKKPQEPKTQEPSATEGGKEETDMDQTGQSESNTPADNVPGTMLSLTALAEEQQVLVNDSGMNGTGGRIHLHSNAAEDMYAGKDTSFVFDLGHIEKLGLLYLWNYNEAGNTACGLKEIKISVSEDNVTFSEPKTYTLLEASGTDGLSAAILDGEKEIDLEGATGRYLKIEAVSNYGGELYGLSEVRLFRYRHQNMEDESISCSPLERYINGKWSAQPEDYNLTNGSGLSDFRSAQAVHDNLPEHMLAQDAKEFEFTIDLKGEYPVSKIVLWNYNDPEHLEYGLKKFRLKVSDDYSIWKTVGTYTLDQANGQSGLKPSLTIELEEEVRAHYLQIEILSNYGGEKTGLSEVSVFLGKGWYCDSSPDYSALLSNYEGWTGADGIYTVNLDGKDYDFDRNSEELKTFFIFSDTILSTVNPVTKLRSNVSMPNNTSALLTGGKPDCSKMEFYYPQEGETANIIPNPKIPATKAGKFIYYWLGDTFVIGDSLYVYCLRIDSVNTVFGFDQIGVDLAKYKIKDGAVDLESMTLINDGDSRLCSTADPKDKWYFGGAVYQSTEAAGAIDPDGYIYVYGYEDINNQGRQLVVSRVLPEQIETFSEYEYLASDGSWSKEFPEELFHLAQDVAPECSVTQIQSGENKGKFLFINTHITNSPTIKASISAQPYGVFENKTTIFSHDDCLTLPGEGNNTYNAKAHPALSGKDEILISYNINGDDCFKYADIYRPRFIKLGMVAERTE